MPENNRWPPCPARRDDCILSEGGQASTLMGYQQQYRRDGTPVNSDPNWITWNVKCSTCGRAWSARKKGDAPTEWFGGKLAGEG